MVGHVSLLHVPAVSFKASKLTRTRYPYGCWYQALNSACVALGGWPWVSLWHGLIRAPVRPGRQRDCRIKYRPGAWISPRCIRPPGTFPR